MTEAPDAREIDCPDPRACDNSCDLHPPAFLDPVRAELHQLRTENADLTQELATVRDTLRHRSNALNATGTHNDQLRATLTDLAQHGTRHDLMPTHRPGDEAFWHRYIEDMDSNVRTRAARALADKEPTP